MKVKSYINIPNTLSLIRLALVPVVVGCFAASRPILGLLVFILAGATDMIDGHLARKLGQVTLLGKLIDPLADKLMLLAVLTCLGVRGLVPWWLIGVMVIKESIMGIGTARLLRYSRTIVMSNVYGKAATMLFFVTVVIIVLGTQFSALSSTGSVMLYVSLCAALLALGQYTREYFRIQGDIKSGVIKPDMQL